MCVGSCVMWCGACGARGWRGVGGPGGAGWQEDIEHTPHSPQQHGQAAGRTLLRALAGRRGIRKRARQRPAARHRCGATVATVKSQTVHHRRCPALAAAQRPPLAQALHNRGQAVHLRGRHNRRPASRGDHQGLAEGRPAVRRGRVNTTVCVCVCVCFAEGVEGNPHQIACSHPPGERLPAARVPRGCTSCTAAVLGGVVRLLCRRLGSPGHPAAGSAHSRHAPHVRHAADIPLTRRVCLPLTATITIATQTEPPPPPTHTHPPPPPNPTPALRHPIPLRPRHLHYVTPHCTQQPPPCPAQPHDYYHPLPHPARPSIYPTKLPTQPLHPCLHLRQPRSFCPQPPPALAVSPKGLHHQRAHLVL